MATLFIDYENGNDNYAGTSFNPLASGTDGRISSYTFSSATANFPNDGSLAPIKNILGVSEALEEVNAWNGNNITYTRSTINPPSGLFTSWDIKETTANNTHSFVSTITIAQFTIGTLYTISLYAKPNGRNQVTLQFTSDNTRAARFDLSNGTVAQTGTNATANISSVGDGWYRISITVTATATSHQMLLGLTNDTYNAVSLQSYLGDINRGIYISSPQIEASSGATSYEKPPDQRLTIWNGTSYLLYRIVQYINSTSLFINLVTGGAAIGNQSVDRQYYIGGRWKDITTGATGARLFQGDEIRIMSSPDPTLVGNATFTSSILQNTININSSTNASPISVTANNHGYVTGDTVVITGHTVNTNANGTWEITVTGTNTFTLDGSTGNGVGGTTGTVRLRDNTVIRLASAVTANIASVGNRGNGRTAWTASANVTATLDTADFKEGDCSDSIAVAAGFTTGKAAYKATGTLDLSGYQQVSFWIKNTAGTVPTTGNLSLRLCTDALGNTSVHTVAIPALVVANRWVPITVNLATNLNSTIQSVALYVDSDIGAQTILLCNILACKASSSDDSLTLQSLIGKNTVNEGWWGGIQSINGTRLMLDNETNILPNSANNRGYFGVSETTSLYKRETFKTPLAVNNNTTYISLLRSGTLNNPIDIKFGYDRTNMTSQNGMTFFDGLNSVGIGIYFLNRNYYNISNLGAVRYNVGFQPQSAINVNFSKIIASNCSSFGIYIYGVSNSIINNCVTFFNLGTGFYMSVSSIKTNTSNITTYSNAAAGILIDYSSNAKIQNIKAHNNTNGFQINHSQNDIISNVETNFNGNRGIITSGGAANNTFINCSTSGNVISSIQNSSHGHNIFQTCIFSEAAISIGSTNYTNARAIVINNNNTTNNYYHWTDNGVIYNSVAVRYSNSGFSWAMAPTSSTLRDSAYPLDFPIAKIAVSANSLVTVKAWMRRTSTFLTTGLRIKGGQIAGAPNDITSYMTAAADTWEQVTLNFTPTEVGVVEILAECYGGSTFTAYVDDISITQV